METGLVLCSPDLKCFPVSGCYIGRKFPPKSRGSEQGGKHRPVLIISNNIGNRYSATVIVAAITGMEHDKANPPTHVIAKGYEFLEKDSIILLEQIRTLDKQRLQKYIGTFDRRLMLSVEDAPTISIR